MATRNSIDTRYPIEVGAGGHGNTSLTANTVLCGGTSSTNPLQTVSGTGSTGQILLSNGTSQLPSFQTVSTAADFVLISHQAEDNTTNPLVFTLPSTYSNYVLIIEEAYAASVNDRPLLMQLSTNGGSSYVGTSYYAGVNYLALGSSTLQNTSVSAAGAFRLSAVLNVINPRYYARINLFNMNNNDTPFYTGECLFKHGSTGSVVFGSMLGWNGNSLTVDAFKLFLSGNPNWIASATLYGLAKT